MDDFEILRQTGAVLFVFALLGAALWVLERRRGGDLLSSAFRGKSPGTLAIVDRVRLTPQHSVMLVRAGGRGLLLSVHPSGCTLLEARPMADFVAEEVPR